MLVEYYNLQLNGEDQLIHSSRFSPTSLYRSSIFRYEYFVQLLANQNNISLDLELIPHLSWFSKCLSPGGLHHLGLFIMFWIWLSHLWWRIQVIVISYSSDIQTKSFRNRSSSLQGRNHPTLLSNTLSCTNNFVGLFCISHQQRYWYIIQNNSLSSFEFYQPTSWIGGFYRFWSSLPSPKEPWCKYCIIRQRMFITKWI